MNSGTRCEYPIVPIHDQARGQQRAEEMNAERSGDEHPQPGGGRPDHVGEGAVGVLQEDVDPLWWKRWSSRSSG